MCEIVYSVTGPSVDRKYGIVALNQRDSHCAVVMPFLQDYSDAKRFADALNKKQVSVSDFCDAFLAGCFEELI